MTTAGDAVTAAQRRLAEAGVTEPRLDAQVLLGHVLGCGREGVVAHPERWLDAAERGRFEALVAGRAARRPVAQLVGEREFWSLPFEVTPDTLTPRPDSETVVAAVLARLPDRGARLRILDLGTGTGCLLLALLSELPGAEGTGVDRSPAALAVARRNADRLGLGARSRLLQGSWGEALAGPFDVVVANPPYVPDGVIEALEPEVARFEPRGALAGGADGLDAYRAILPDLPRLLADSGFAVLEVGDGQADAVAAIARASRLGVAETHLDLAGKARCVVLVPWSTRKK